jgi:serine/threonine protein kinase
MAAPRRLGDVGAVEVTAVEAQVGGVGGAHWTLVVVHDRRHQLLLMHRIRDCLQGDVWEASIAAEQAGGGVLLVNRVAVKRLHREAVAAGKALVGDRDGADLRLGQSVNEDVAAELRAMSFLCREAAHPGVVRFFDALQDDTWLYIVMELVDGRRDLSDVRAAAPHGRLLEPVARHLFAGLLGAVRYLHAKGVCHRDISLENAAVTPHEDTKLLDLGLACEAAVHRAWLPHVPPRRVGKALYMPPEIFARVEPCDGRAADAWTLGMSLFLMLFGMRLFETPSPADAAFAFVAQSGLDALLRHWRLRPLASDGAVEVLTALLRARPEERARLADVARHPWLAAEPAASNPALEARLVALEAETAAAQLAAGFVVAAAPAGAGAGGAGAP